MGVHEARHQLDKSLKKLLAHWQLTREQWNDARSEKFQTEHLAVWSADIRRATTAMNQITQILSAIRGTSL